MDLSFVGSDNGQFDAEKYLRILIVIAKSDPGNGPPEYAFVRKAAERLGLDYQLFLDTTDKSYTIDRHSVSRLTALVILKDAILLASLDRNFSLPERQRVYTFAEKMDIARGDVDELEAIVKTYRELNSRWLALTKQ